MNQLETSKESKGLIYNIQRFSTEDGPGVRTTVFFQGCPLKCLWCSNPESKEYRPQMMFFSKICTECGACLEACPTGASKKKEDGSLWVDRDICTNCGACVDVCPNDARSIAGKWMTVEEVFNIIQKDSLYYTNSEGGVTISGGECTMQPEFVQELLEKCYNRAIHVCLDTCGFAPWDTLEKILPKVDLVLYDIKHLDPKKHKEFTGVDNKLILDNAGRMKQMNVKMIIRLPLIPGYNDDEKNIKATGRFMKLWGLDRIDILPYHKLGVNKYEALGEKYLLDGIPSLQRENVARTVQILESFGLKVEVY